MQLLSKYTPTDLLTFMGLNTKIRRYGTLTRNLQVSVSHERVFFGSFYCVNDHSMDAARKLWIRLHAVHKPLFNMDC